jgi:predicted transcriptional regulator
LKGNRKKNVLDTGKRGKLEIIAAVLAVALEPSTLSRIVRRTNTNNSIIRDKLKFMAKTGFIKKQSVTKSLKKVRVFEATEKGIIFLRTYCDLLKMLYGDSFLEKANDLAVDCLQLSKKT